MAKRELKKLELRGLVEGLPGAVASASGRNENLEFVKVSRDLRFPWRAVGLERRRRGKLSLSLT